MGVNMGSGSGGGRLQNTRYGFTYLIMTVLLVSSLLLVEKCAGDGSNAHLSKPNRDRDKSLERLFGLGFVLPYPYFQKPRYRYPVYDRKGRGSLVYGYGGRETFQYKTFTPIEGHH